MFLNNFFFKITEGRSCRQYKDAEYFYGLEKFFINIRTLQCIFPDEKGFYFLLI